MDRTLRIVVGEDRALVREGIVRMLERAGFDVVGTAGDAVDLVAKTLAHRVGDRADGEGYLLKLGIGSRAALRGARLAADRPA